MFLVSMQKHPRLPLTRELSAKLTEGEIFNKLYESGMMSKDEAYRWLALITYSPQTYAHIGNMGEYYCKVVIDESRKLYQTLSERRGTA